MAEQEEDARDEPGHSRDNVKLEPMREEQDNSDQAKEPAAHKRGGAEPQADGSGG